VNKVVGWGIVGCGDVADRKSGESFNRVPGSRLVSVMRRDEAAAHAFARRHGAEHWCTDAQMVIEHPEVDAVYLATPPAHHLEYALAIAAAGKPCLVEKPAGRSLAEFRRMHEAFRSAGLPLFVSFYRRHLPRFRKVKEILASGALGQIVGIDYRMSKPARDKGWATNVALSGGGHFYGLSCHILDLFDDWFGPLEYAGSSATNSIPREPAEDAVALSFRTAGGAVGAALWNFAASGSGDQLVIEGVRGRITMRGTATDKPVRVDFEPSAKVRISQRRRDRWLIEWRDRLGLSVADTYRFAAVKRPHEAMLTEVTKSLQQGGDIPDNADAALRTAEFVDRSLSAYYRGRDDAFWTRPATWQSLQAEASRRNQGPLPAEYRLTEDELQRFSADGYIGPFRCEADWQRLIVPVKKGRNRHLDEADVFAVCTHPSVIRRVAQVMGRSRFSLFKTRFVVKMPRSRQTVVAWHQDVGDRNGGFSADGKAVPTLAVWMGIDEIDPGNGGLEVIPGSHTRLIGDYNRQIKSSLIETGALTQTDLDRAVPVVLRPGEFIIYHGWLLHGSRSNTSERRRAGLNMRFAPPALECEDEFVYIPIETADVPYHDLVFANDTWNGRPSDVPGSALPLARAG
jgi:1,5-anhydro-D-fructose reductase (1,5-anhydro-D-mannitol-forming)